MAVPEDIVATTDNSRPVLYLHIGRGKAGSSAIQRLLLDNRAALRRLGYLVPDNELEMDGVFQATQLAFFRRLSAITQDDVELVTKRLGRLAKAGGRAVVVSSENLSASADFARLFVPAAALFDIVVVLYIRRQDDYLESAWSQWEFKSEPDLRAWAAREWDRGNWDRLVEGWETYLPSARYVIRVYDRERFPQGDIVYDFLEVLGVAPGDLAQVGGREVNRKLNEIAMRVALRNPDLFEHRNDNRFATFLRRYGAAAVHEPTSAGIFWTAAEREELVASYAESNERLRMRHLPELPPNGLFSTTFRASGPLLSPEAQATRELDLLWHVVFRIGEMQTGKNRTMPGAQELARRNTDRQRDAHASTDVRVRLRRVAGAARRRVRRMVEKVGWRPEGRA